MDGHYLPDQVSTDEVDIIRTILVGILRELSGVMRFVNNIQVRRNPIHSLIALDLLWVIRKIQIILNLFDR